ncbi:MAG: hypothetical protein ACYC7D_05680 [Nitrososphaerales archaeon]
MRRLNRQRKAVSTIIGAVIVFGIFLSVGYGYFYTVTQESQSYQKTGFEGQLSSIQQNLEQLQVNGLLQGSVIGFQVNNSGIAATVVSYFITDSSSGELYFNSGTSSNPVLPYAISQGGSVTFTTNVFYTQGHSYSIKLLTQRGSTFVGTYPPKQLNTKVANALVAAGLGSMSMVFSSYTFYNLTEDDGWAIDVANPHPGGLLPYGVQPAFSMQITNNDPSIGTITLDSHTEIYLYAPCSHGCGGNVPIFAYFVVNAGNGGAISSTTKGSFSPISIPYGATQILYFASANDLSVNSFAAQSMSGKVSLGEYDVFVIISGSDTQSTNSVLYSQNLPFAGSYLASNVAWFSETPPSCTHASPNSFSLTFTNSVISSGKINQVSLNATGFSLIGATKPSGWSTLQISGTVITWSGGYVNTGHSITFDWSGTAPATVGSQVIFPITITFSSGTTTTQETAAGCFVT